MFHISELLAIFEKNAPTFFLSPVKVAILNNFAMENTNPLFVLL